MRQGTLIGLVILGAIGIVLIVIGILPGWQLIIFAGIFIVAILIERSSYRRTLPVNRNLQATGEVFEDPTTEKKVSVLYDPATGERYYDDTNHGGNP